MGRVEREGERADLQCTQLNLISWGNPLRCCAEGRWNWRGRRREHWALIRSISHLLRGDTWCVHLHMLVCMWVTLTEWFVWAPHSAQKISPRKTLRLSQAATGTAENSWGDIKLKFAINNSSSQYNEGLPRIRAKSHSPLCISHDLVQCLPRKEFWKCICSTAP